MEAIKLGQGSVGCENARERVGPLRLGSMTDGMEGLLGKSSLLKGPRWKGSVHHGDKE